MTPLPPERYTVPENRTLVPEILDSLPSDHPDAIASRRDLHRINFMMGNYRFLRRYWLKYLKAGEASLELGAGGGQMRDQFSHLTTSPELTGIDLAPRPADWPDSWHWLQQDLFATETTPYGIILASLTLHHFSDQQLVQLGNQIRPHTRVMIFTEPLRSSFSHTLGRWAELAGIHPVTRHDMHVSIDAGFRMGELPDLLGLSAADWHIDEWHDWRGSLRVVACRR